MGYVGDKKTKLRVYIAGPYTSPDPVANTQVIIKNASELVALGFIPYIPHLTMLWHLIESHSYEYWVDRGLEWLEVCDVLLRVPGYSVGADREVEWAKKHGIPVFYSVAELVNYVRKEE
jgi:hypothetical protein